ncbi:MAG: cytochrome b N-terminal domain-containing protein [Alphaproteobacteria bacterium]|nr:cytochrome b N-terminal domain-containing protein [Alphaproteobacteria bacterium]MDE2013728.1 cytochrome b N-terminal domain-containing protein [Alphaproteobacteria bacterium]MDE2073981.1 cytochrome b N-terminal domain-containing protein [Alphaproteobacteria bacterium]MDE2350878.1 cytochrome b N-terminal domain-containing protein [Alphaproteobacteria bacterium]
MSGPSTYTPSNGFTRWLDSRLPLLRFMNDTMVTFPTPRNLNVWYTFGGILTFCLAVQIVTGVVLAMHFTPTAAGAFDSVENIMRDVNYGWLIRYVHANGASMFFLAVYIHMFRGLYYGSYKAPREVLWILGVIIYLLMMATAFFGYVLPWGQMSFWGATVITNLFSSLDQVVPHMGTAIAHWLWGGFAVGDPTLNRFFSLHYLLPFVIAAVVGLHIWALHVPGNNNPLGIDVKGPQDTLPFHPYYTVKDAFYMVLFAMLFAVLVFYAPNFVGNPDNYTPANPLATPAHIVPEWYLLPYYAMLRAVPQKLLGVLVLFGAIATLVFIPWLDTSKVRSLRYRPMLKPFFWVLFFDCILLGYLGSQEPQATTNVFGLELSDLLLARIGAIYYYAFFWICLPVIGLIEKPKPLPQSIAQAVLGSHAAAAAE